MTGNVVHQTTADAPAQGPAQVELSIVVPAFNEQDNVDALVEQVRFAVLGAGIAAELIVVDDGSTDDTAARVAALADDRPWLRVLRQGRRLGQSAAMYRGIQAARGRYLATLDADLQNDPADLPAMLALLHAGEADMVQGDRSANRRDNVVRRVASVVGRKARRWILADPTRDTGCSTRVLRTDDARRFPLYLHGMHRFLPACARMYGLRVVERPVHHRRRHAGQTKYGLGVMSRAVSGLCDCLAVRWMRHRYREVPRETRDAPIEQGTGR